MDTKRIHPWQREDFNRTLLKAARYQAILRKNAKWKRETRAENKNDLNLLDGQK